MSLSALTISTSSGIVGRPFSATISGKSAGSTIDILPEGTPGFWSTNGVLHHEALPGLVSTAVVRETLSGTGTRDTRLTINAANADHPLVDGNASVANGGTVSVTNSAGAHAHDATAAVSGNTLGSVALAAGVALVDGAVALVVPVTGTYVDTITPTVALGVVTGFVLS